MLPHQSDTRANASDITDQVVPTWPALQRIFGRRTPSPLVQFLAVAGLIISLSMGALTFFISERVKAATTQSVAEEGAALIASMIGPSVQELNASPRLSPDTSARLDRILQEQSGGVKAVKIWMRDGTLVYATDKKLVGSKFPSENLDRAFGGAVVASFDDMAHPENEFDRLLNIPLFEIYAPLYRTGTTDVIAVGEIYQDGRRLAAQLQTLTYASAGIVAAVVVPMMLMLYLVVHRANSIIDRHQAALTQTIRKTQELASLNERLRHVADEARMEAGRSNEQLLAQIGQDLHDGPIQLLSLLMLKLTDGHIYSPSIQTPADPAKTVAADPQTLAARILREVREISTGLVLPQLGGLGLAAVIELAIREHEYVTGTAVLRQIGPLPNETPSSVSSCLFRVVQEGLNNAFRHADANTQSVECRLDGTRIHLTIRDRGASKPPANETDRKPRPGLGLDGIKRRVEALGGSFSMSTAPDGSTLSVQLPLGDGSLRT